MPLKLAIGRYLLARFDDLDFLAMELDRRSLRWRSNLSRNPTLITLEAWLDYSAGDIEGADGLFRRAIELRDDYLPALRGRAMAMMSANRYRNAADAFRMLCDAYPSDAEAHYNHGVLLTRIGQFGRATAAFNSALSIDPKHARSLYNLAAIAQRDGRLADARDYWERFTQVEPNVISVWFNLGIVYMDFRQPLEAANCFEAAVSINPDDVVTRVNLALAYMEAGHLEAAECTLQLANEDEPCTPAVLDALVEANRRIAEWVTNRERFLARAESIEADLEAIWPPEVRIEQVAGDPTHGESAGLIGP